MKPALLSLAILFAATPVVAQTYTYQFSGAINAIQNPNDAVPGVSMGQSFTGLFSYHSDTPTSKVGEITFTLGSFQPAAIDSECLISVNNYPPETDSFSAMYYDTQSPYNFGRTGIVLEDADCTAFSSDQLPTDLDLAMFEVARFDICGNKGTDYFTISGPITSLTQVPEPATLLLVLCGGICLRQRNR